MSLYFAFWREKENQEYPQPSEIYDAVFEEETAEKLDLETLPHDKIVSDLKNTFKDWTIEGDDSSQLDFVSKDLSKSVIAGWMGNVYFTQCAYTLTNYEINSIFDVFNKYGCAVYDIQTGERFQQPEPTA